MAALEKKVEAYGFAAKFERAVVFLACANPRFYGRVGYALDPAAMQSEHAKLALTAAQLIAKETGIGPTSTLLVIQRIRRMVTDGKVTHEQLNAVSDLFDAVEDDGVPAEDGVVAELVPVLQLRLRREAAHRAAAEFGKRGDLLEVADMIHRAARLGANDTSVGTKLGGASWKAMESLRHLERLPTGIMELDSLLSGGLGRGQQGVLIGGPGDGKSMGLSHILCNAAIGGLFCAYATLELPKEQVLARIKGNITNMPIDAVLEGHAEAMRRLEQVQLGPVLVKDFTANATHVGHLRDWVKECEDEEGRKLDVLFIDYADKLGAPSKKDKSQYEVMGAVYEDLRTFAAEQKLWEWTASQSTGRNDKKEKKLDLHNVADSMHKVRVADLVITLNAKDEGEQMLFYVAKNRTGKSRQSVGPLPCDFTCGQIAPCVRDFASRANNEALQSREVEHALGNIDLFADVISEPGENG